MHSARHVRTSVKEETLKTRITEHKQQWPQVIIECQCRPFDEDKPKHGLGGRTRGGQVKQVEVVEAHGECVHQDQEDVQHGSSGSSQSLVRNSLIRHLEK